MITIENFITADMLITKSCDLKSHNNTMDT